jgi:tetratricopeptide (TPR) repeat protein
MKQGRASGLFVLLLLALPLAALAQTGPITLDEPAGLRAAAAAESAGDLAGAERILGETLRAHPTSIGALLAYERVLTLQRRTEQLLPAIDALLKQEPASAVAHQMRLRTWAALERPAEIERTGRAWAAAAPRTETPYREVAKVWRARGDYPRAVQVLEQGRRQLGRPDALALDLGDTYAEAADVRRAVQEWSRAVGPEGQGFILVQRRLAGLADGGARYIEPFVVQLTAPPTTVARQRAAINVAIEAGLPSHALATAPQVLAALPARDRRTFLVETARRADGAGLAPVAYWAYGELVGTRGSTGEQMLAIRSRLAELALAVGDTAAAAATYRELEDALAPGSPERRQAMAVRIGLTAREGRLEQAEQEFRAFRDEYRGAPEQGRIAVALAAAMLEHDDLDAAERVLAGVPGAVASLGRGRVFLRRGELARARSSFLESAPALRGAEATQTIALAALIGRLSAEGSELLAGALLASEEGDRGGAVERIVTGSVTLDGAERAALLEFAASHATAGGLDEYADQVRRELVEQHPDAREAPGALLGLARSLLRRGEATEALPLLERVLVEHPRSALAPQARRELERLTQPAARHRDEP